jgi:hypothetical protein
MNDTTTKIFRKWRAELTAILRAQGENLLIERRRAAKDSTGIPFTITRPGGDCVWVKDFENIFTLPPAGCRISIEKLFEGGTRIEVLEDGSVKEVEL